MNSLVFFFLYTSHPYTVFNNCPQVNLNRETDRETSLTCGVFNRHRNIADLYTMLKHKKSNIYTLFIKLVLASGTNSSNNLKPNAIFLKVYFVVYSEMSKQN